MIDSGVLRTTEDVAAAWLRTGRRLVQALLVEVEVEGAVVAEAGDSELARVHAPCGLDIGSRTAEETAVSVLAEVIAVRAQRAARPLRATDGPIHGRDGDPVAAAS